MIRFISKKWLRNRNREHQSDPSTSRDNNESNGAPKILTDMIDDCLEHIFLYLSIGDLLNIVHTNKQLKPAAELAFVRNFGRGKLVVLKTSRLAIRINETEQVKLPNHQTYQFLRCFGHLILKQTISSGWYKYPSPHRNIFKYLNQYCNKSTSEFTFKTTKMCSGVKKPFYNAETVRFERCRFGAKLNRLHKLFPNLRTLSMDNCSGKFKHIEAHFPHLNHLEIRGAHMGFRRSPHVKILHLNPQLRCLVLETIFDGTLLQVAGKHLQFLEYIRIFLLGCDVKRFDKIANFESLKELEISVSHLRGKIPISSKCLEKLSFQHSRHARNHNMDILLDFLNKHPTIKKISLTSLDYNMVTIREDILMRIIEALSSMEEIDISMLNISVYDVIKFLNHCKFLKKFCFAIEANVDLDHLKTRLGPKWQAASTENTEFEMNNITITCSE